ncbi:MAG: TfoX/Sxy family protein [Bauldia sp.]
MAFDEKLAAKVRAALAGLSDVSERKMFGGIAFMRGGAMLIGVDKEDLIVRCAREDTDAVLQKPGVRIFDLSGGRPMKGWLLVGREATNTAKGLRAWIDFAVAYAASAAGTPKKKR